MSVFYHKTSSYSHIRGPGASEYAIDRLQLTSSPPCRITINKRIIINNYSPKWRWIVVDKYPPPLRWIIVNYCSCHPTWPPGSLSFESHGNGCKPLITSPSILKMKVLSVTFPPFASTLWEWVRVRKRVILSVTNHDPVTVINANLLTMRASQWCGCLRLVSVIIHLVKIFHERVLVKRRLIANEARIYIKRRACYNYLLSNQRKM